MKFGWMHVDKAKGALLAHSIRTQQGTLKKGRVLSHDDTLSLKNSGIEKVVAARLDIGDVSEDMAAKRVALSARGNGVSM